MRRVAFLTLVFFFAILVSGSQAHEVELVSNGCGVIECEAVLKVVPDRDLTTASAQNWDYRFDYYIEEGNLKSIDYEIGKEVSEIVYGQKESCQRVEIPDVNKGGTIWVDSCETVPDYSKASVEKRVDWQPGFFGKNMESGKTYYVRITGERAKPYLGEFKADWVLTFDKVEYKQWSWWNAGWTYKRPVLLKPATTLWEQTIAIPIDFTDANYSGKVLVSLNDVRIVDENNNIELDRICNSGADGNCYFRMPYSIQAGDTSEQISTYYIYYNNAGAGAPDDANAEPEWVEGFEANTIGQWTGATTSTATVRFGATSLTRTTVNIYKPITGLGSLGDDNVADFNYSVWMQNSDNTKSAGFSMRNAGGDAISEVGWRAGSNGEFYYYNGATRVDTGVVASANTWYQVKVHIGKTTGWKQIGFYDTSGALLASGAGGTKTVGEAGDDVTQLWLESEAGADFFADNIYESPPVFAGFGAEEEFPTSQFVDLNIWSIDGYDVSGEFPKFTYASDGNLTIDFNVYNVDNNAMTVDINYSTSPTQGTGTAIVVDLNLTALTCTNAMLWSVNDTNCAWDWNISGVADNNYYILIDLNGGSQSVFEALGKTLRIESPTLSIIVHDENTGIPLVSPTVTFNGADYSPNSRGLVSLTTTSLSGVYTVSIAEDNNYSTRYFDFDLNTLMGNLDANVYVLRDLNGGSNVSFKFYDTDESTVLAGKKVYLLHDDDISSIRYTNAGGETSFYLNADDNYVFGIVKDSTDVLNYYPTKVTIQIPKDEADQSPISPYDVTMHELGAVQWLQLTAAQGYGILPNTVGYYNFDVNGGGTYYPRSYLVNTRGDTPTYSLQAYLSKISASSQYTFYATDARTGGGVSEVLIVIKKVITGEGLVTIAELETDVSGTAQFSFIVGDEYVIEIYYQGNLKLTDTLRPTSASFEYPIIISTEEWEYVSPTISFIDLNFLPVEGYLTIYSTSDWNYVDFNVAIGIINATISSIDVIVRGCEDINRIHYTSPWVNGTLVSFQFDANFDAEFGVGTCGVQIIVDVNATDGNTWRRMKSYTVSSRADRIPLWEQLVRLGASLNEGTGSLRITTFAAFLVIILCIGVLAAGGLRDPLGLSILGGAILGIFVAIGWVEYGLFVLIGWSMFVLGLLVFTRGV